MHFTHPWAETKMFEFALYISIVISILGVTFQLFRFRKEGQFFNGSQPRPPIATFSHFKNFVLNTFLQIKLFKAGKIRWTFHSLLFLSFLYLVVVHALHEVAAPFFIDDYTPTIDPYQFLRNLTGVLVLTGCVAFLARRWVHRFPGENLADKHLKYKGVFSILLIALLVCSGFLLEASKIISEPVFMEMVEDYSDLGEETELLDLKLFWENNYLVVFTKKSKITPNAIPTGSSNRPGNNALENGQVLNEAYCSSCHSNLESAFLSKTLAKALHPAGNFLNHHRSDALFYLIHYSLCLLLLMTLPFSRLFHLLLIPVSSSQQPLTLEAFQANGAFINGASLHGCTNCGYCSRVCSVYPHFQITGNLKLLPHWKIESAKAMIKDPSIVNLWQLHSGNGECTYCHKCTDICPSGIDLQSLWSVLDKKLVTMGYADNRRFIENSSLEEWAKTAANTRLCPEDEVMSNLTDGVDAFENCIQCTICTNVCPIVDYDSDQNDITPQQVMNLLRLGQKHLATKTRMVWTCLGCYSCQEHCPREIKVADILMELRNHGSANADRMKQTPKIHKADI